MLSRLEFNSIAAGSSFSSSRLRLFRAIELAHEAIVEELRGCSLLRFRRCFREKIQDALNSRLGNHQLAPETRLAIEFVGPLDNVRIAFFGVFSDDFHREGLVVVVTVDAR